MLLRILSTIILGTALFLTGCNDVTDAELSQERQIMEPANLETSISMKNGNSTNGTILDIAGTNDNFSILAQAVVFAGLDGALDKKRQLTVFAPTNAAFAKLLSEGQTAEDLLQSLGKETVKNILLYHVAPGKRQSNAVLGSEQINTLLKKFIDVEMDGDNLTVGNNENGFSTVTATNIYASNGVIHVIDAVMLPPTSSLPPVAR